MDALENILEQFFSFLSIAFYFCLILEIADSKNCSLRSIDHRATDTESLRLYNFLEKHKLIQHDIVKYIDIDCSYESKFLIHEHYAQPDNGVWSICRYCGWKGKGIELYNSSSTVLDNVNSIILSSSLWQEFFHYLNDKYYITRAVDHPKYIIDRPVFILPSICYHPGHLLVDILESLHHTMMEVYGKIRKDSLIILDSSNIKQWSWLQADLDYEANEQKEAGINLGSLLKAYTDIPVRSAINITDELSSFNILYEALHIGVDSSHSYYYRSYRFHPVERRYDESSRMFRDDLSSLQRSFSTYLKNYTKATFDIEHKEAEYPSVLIVQRKSSRVIDNLSDLAALLDSRRIRWEARILEKFSFRRQVQFFAHIDILIAAAGTAIHNSIFMKPGSSVIILMPRGLCDWTWIYSSQLTILGIQSHVLCDEEEVKGSQYGEVAYHWARKTWLQPNRVDKDGNVSVSIKELSRVLDSIYAGNGRESSIPLKTSSVRSGVLNISTISFPGTESIIQAGLRDIDFVPPFGILVEGMILGNSGALKRLLQSMKTLAICFNTPTIPEFPTWCRTIDTLDYYGSTTVNCDVPNVLLSFWLQASIEGGRISNSEVYYPFDLNYWKIYGRLEKHFLNKTIEFPLKLFESVSSDGTRERWGVVFPTDQIEAAAHCSTRDSDCLVPIHTELKVNVSDLSSVQRFIPRFCSQWELSRSACMLLAMALFRDLSKLQILESEGLPPRQSVPTLSNPFVFMHVEKSGGTTTRDFVVNASVQRHFGHFVPCYGHLSCLIFELPRHLSGAALEKALVTPHMEGYGLGGQAPEVLDLSNVSVIGGHFNWNVWKRLPACDERLNKSCRPSCLFINRHPVSRIISYYYDRVYGAPDPPPGGHPRINDLTPEQLDATIIGFRWGRWRESSSEAVCVDEGMESATCRAMAGLKATSGASSDSNLKIPDELTWEEENLAIQNMQQCVVGVLEDWSSTIRMLNFWFPWMDFIKEPSFTRNKGKNNRYETLETLRPELREVIMRRNKCDMRLYEETLRLFEKQKKVVDSDYFSLEGLRQD